MRHGQTDYNKQGLLQGQVDIPLNDEGIKQALAAKKQIDLLDIDLVICSPLKRAIKTAKMVTFNKKIIVDERIIERNLGVYEGQPSLEYDHNKYYRYEENNTGGNVEGIKEITNRAQMFLDDLKTNYLNKKILIVTHGAFINALLYAINPHLVCETVPSISLKNCEYVKIII
ncbi:MAG: histidine phosphatase family protein [Bacilli bacterium]|nr:histidine phosphatase family protein [Bacilli bacterium]